MIDDDIDAEERAQALETEVREQLAAGVRAIRPEAAQAVLDALDDARLKGNQQRKARHCVECGAGPLLDLRCWSCLHRPTEARGVVLEDATRAAEARADLAEAKAEYFEAMSEAVHTSHIKNLSAERMAEHEAACARFERARTRLSALGLPSYPPRR